jgi:hypothetical protein
MAGVLPRIAATVSKETPFVTRVSKLQIRFAHRTHRAHTGHERGTCEERGIPKRFRIPRSDGIDATGSSVKRANGKVWA